MRKEFLPAISKLYVFNHHCLLFIKEGNGIFEVDFTKYNFESNRIIFLSPRQYFRLLSGNFTIIQYEFTDESIDATAKSRFLFKHLVSLGHISLDCKKPFHLNQFTQFNFDENSISLLHDAIEDWIVLNPFNTTEDEVDLLFDVKEIIDRKYNEPVELADVSKQLKQKPWKIQSLVKQKLHSSLLTMTHKQKLLEAERKIAFTDSSIKEIAYELGFANPDYFFKFFKLYTQQTPLQFKEQFGFNTQDSFVNNLTELIENNFKESFKMAFYARELAMSEKTLSRKISERLGTSFIDLLHNRKLKEAKQMISNGVSVTDTAFELGFKETSHFSVFFKKQTGSSPLSFAASA
ncbi:MAG: AraC family transcriptional regulator [Sediminibacterium sp.]